MTPDQRRVLTTTCMSHALIHIYELSIPALLWLIQSEFGTDDLQMGKIATVYALLFGAWIYLLRRQIQAGPGEGDAQPKQAA
jgi:hypothetical protein